MHPLGYFASAPDGTFDAAILSSLVSRYGSYLERLNSEQKLALRAILSYYLFYKLKVISDYSVIDAITDAMPEYTEASIRNVIATLEGISSDTTEGLIKFLTDQRSDRAELLATAAPHSHTSPIHSQKLAMVDRMPPSRSNCNRWVAIIKPNWIRCSCRCRLTWRQLTVN